MRATSTTSPNPIGSLSPSFFFSLLRSCLELSDTQVYEPQIRALLGADSHFCEVVVRVFFPLRATGHNLKRFYLRILVYLVIYDSG